MIFNILFLPVLFFIGVITTYEDFRFGKVRNKWILLSLSWGLGILVFFLIWYFIAPSITHFFSPDAPVFTVNPSYILRVLLNAALSLIIAFLMWRGGAWAAGDAKLFFIYALLLPLGYYQNSYLPVFPSFALMINIFIPVFLYLLLRSILFYGKFLYTKFFQPQLKKEKSLKEKEEARKKRKKAVIERLKAMGVLVIVFVNIFLIFNFLQEPINKYFSFNISSFQAFVFAGIIIFRRVFSDLFKNPIVIKSSIVLLILILAYGSFVSFSSTWILFLKMIRLMLIFMAAFTLLASLIDFYVSRTGTRRIKVSDLKPKMNLEESVLNQIKKDKECQEKIGLIRPDGLSVEQVRLTREWLEKNKTEEITIYKPFPFVLWMLVGVMVTIVLKSSVFHLIINVG
ncbi:MAG: hypothetical protein ABH889_00580 [Candidatus Portnoybacteria bacterium]